MIYDPLKHFSEDEAYDLGLAQIQLNTALYHARIAKTEADKAQAQAEKQEAQETMKNLYLDYITAARKARQEAMPLDYVLTVTKMD